MNDYNEDFFNNCFFSKDTISYNPTSFEFRKKMITYMEIISKEYKFNSQTLFISISILDKLLLSEYDFFLHKKYNFVALTILWISSKFEESVPLYSDEMISLTDFDYKKEDFCQFEFEILKRIQFKIPYTTPYTLLLLYQMKKKELQDQNVFSKCVYELKRRIKNTRYSEKYSILTLQSIVCILRHFKNHPKNEHERVSSSKDEDNNGKYHHI